MTEEPWNHPDKEFLDWMNGVSVSKDELIELINETEQLDVEKLDLEEHIGVTLVRLHAKRHADPATGADQVLAIMCRMEALAKLLQGEGVPGWTQRDASGATLAQTPVVAAAAVEPLIEEDGHVAFDRESFLKTTLRLANVDCIG